MPKLHALLLTDVVDSTRLTEELGDAAMAELWTAHDRVARDLLPRWRGREIDKTDGMLLLFDDVHDAVGYALAYHRALAARELPFKARAGIHVGPVSLRQNPPDDVARGAKPVEVDGLALPIAARVMSAAIGAQTLLSADARLALGVAPQRVMSHGHWRLHGVVDPVELFEVGEIGEGSAASHAPFKAPPDGPKVYRVMRQGDLWQPVREVRHSVPAERDSFVGRQEPLARLAKKFEDSARCVSVLGMGGTGKTRFVTRFAWTVLGDYPGGVWFCDLSQARTVDGIHFAVAQGLDVPLGKAEPVVQLAHAIAGRGRCLVILDNFEQVARFAEATLGRWLDRAPLAQFLVTTREVLGIVGEETLALAPLAASDAAALFLRRAESTRQGYAPSADDLIAIEQLVKVLDGLPLAIELAAARVRVMPPRALLARMHDRFNVLLSRTGRHDRQATLRAAFDWSWELLSDCEKAALAQLSVFEGGFTVPSAEAVLDFTDIGAMSPSVTDVIQWLVDKSFVRDLGGERFDLLESIRDYGAEHLSSSQRCRGSGPNAAMTAMRRHWRHFASMGASASRDGCIELNNVVAACRRATLNGDTPAASAALDGSWSALRLFGPFRVAVDLAASLAQASSLEPRQLAFVHWVAADAFQLLGQLAEARNHLDAGLPLAQHANDARCTARLLASMGSIDLTEGRFSFARERLASALTLAASLDDQALCCAIENTLGHLHDAQGNAPGARGHYEAALAIARRIGDRHTECGALGNLGGLHHDAGRLDDARQNYETGLGMACETGDRRYEGNARCNLGLVHHQQGRTAEAQTEFEAGLRLARELGNVRLEGTCLCNLGIVMETRGELVAAGRHFEEAVRNARALGDPRSEGQFSGHLGLNCAKLGKFDDARRAFADGESLLERVDDALSLALALCQRCEAELLRGDVVAAQQALQAARRSADALEIESGSELSVRLVALSRELLVVT